MSYRVEASRDGETWVHLATTDQTSATFEPGSVAPQGSGWRLRVQASTGLGLAISPEVTADFPTRASVPAIVLPLDGSTVSANTLIELQAATSSFSTGGEDGFEWRVDGVEVGRGFHALVDAGFPGTHTITLTEPVGGATDTVTIVVIADLDLDGMSDEWETAHGFDPRNPADAAADDDGDGLAAWQEFTYGSSPQTVDTDGDRSADGVEATAGTDPTDPTSFPTTWFDGGPAPRLDATPAIDDDGEEDAGGGVPVALLVGLATALGLGAGVLLVRRRRS